MQHFWRVHKPAGTERILSALAINLLSSLLVLADKRDRASCTTGARCSANAMHVGFERVRQIKIDDL